MSEQAPAYIYTYLEYDGGNLIPNLHGAGTAYRRADIPWLPEDAKETLRAISGDLSRLMPGHANTIDYILAALEEKHE